MKKRINKQSGFGILEVLIASSIIAMVAAAALVLGNYILRSAIINKHRLQATHLAADAIEIVRNIRDTNWIDGDPKTVWDENLLRQGQCSIDGCGVEPNNDLTWKMTLSPDNFDYDMTDNGDAFVRNIEIRDVSGSDLYSNHPELQNELQAKTVNVKVIVKWTDYKKEREVVVETLITDWASY